MNKENKAALTPREWDSMENFYEAYNGAFCELCHKVALMENRLDFAKRGADAQPRDIVAYFKLISDIFMSFKLRADEVKDFRLREREFLEKVCRIEHEVFYLADQLYRKLAVMQDESITNLFSKKLRQLKEEKKALENKPQLFNGGRND